MDDDTQRDDSTDPKGLPEPSSVDDHRSARRDEDDLPADVNAALTQLIEGARTAIREGDTDDALDAVDTAATVAANKLPPGDRRETILHGCARVTDLAADDPPVAAEYLDAMRRRLPDQ
ncbi:hypothetical protein [Halobaculum limi]|uniref:hypothetical protein n=1 Tax=Halobaculum limi TaxID=3031916 RepID=UPI002404A627|nr:hypothetical protein [Halobaculum sp. YSMS11]